MRELTFPPGFQWGAATSAFQIEGAAHEDGRGESIWDRFAATPGRVEDGSDARVACDHFHRFREDVELLRSLSLGAYRFSVSWPRVFPSGSGRVNARGLDFYDRLVDALAAAGIAAHVTLNHWDLPQALQDRGGWGARHTAEAFVEYAAAVALRIGDRLHAIATHNEPWCIAHLGHEEGSHAPALKDPPLALRAAHHLLLAHGLAVPVLRALAPRAQIGIVLNLVPAYPRDVSDEDAVRWFDGFFNRWYLDPIFRGSYPADAIADRVARGHLDSPELPFLHAGDLAAIAAAIDFLGVNYYSRAVMTGTPHPHQVQVVPASELTSMGWEVFPRGLLDLLRRVHRDYGPRRLYVTENGIAVPGEEHHDPRRVAFLREHVRMLHAALAEGVPLAGYFHWSLLDNFEWAHGYTRRFGLFHVDRTTLQRIPRTSASVYADIARRNALPLELA